MRTRFSLLPLTLLLISLFLLAAHPGQSAPPRGAVASSFRIDADGWEAWNQEAAVRHDGAGFLVGEGASPAAPWYWSAPAKFLGDQSAATGGSLLFELADSVRRGPRASGLAVILSGGGLSLGCEKPREAADGDFLLCTAELQPGRWRNLTTGEAASAGELLAVLRHLDRLLIRGTRHLDARVGRLRRVVLSPGSASAFGTAAAAAPNLEIKRPLVNFGNCGVRFEVTEQFEITNHGSAEVTLTLDLKQKANPKVFGVFYSGIEILPGGEIRPVLPSGSTGVFEVKYTAAKAGKGDSAQIEIRAEGLKKPLKVKLKGKGIVPLTAPRFKNFGKVTVGSTSAVQEIVVNNLTQAEIGFAIGGEGALDQFDADYQVPTVIQPQASHKLFVRFHPKRLGKIEAKIRIVDTAIGIPARFAPLEIVLRGEGSGGPPVLTVEPTELDFGSIPVGAEARLPFQIANAGADNLTVTLPTLPAPYAWAEPPAGPLIIGALDFRELEVVFTPEANGSHNRSFTIQSDDPNHRQTTVQLKGAGVETFVAFDPPSIDAGAMTLGAGVQRTLRIINVAPFDVHVNVENPLETHPLEREWSVAIEGDHSGLIRVGEELVVTVEFVPAEEGARPTTMRILSRPSDITMEPKEDLIQLNGTGLPVPKGRKAVRGKGKGAR